MSVYFNFMLWKEIITSIINFAYSCRGTRDDIDNEDVQESYFRYMEENPNAGVINEDEDIVDYDSDGNPIMERKKVWSFKN